jgi:hypothetical protein
MVPTSHCQKEQICSKIYQNRTNCAKRSLSSKQEFHFACDVRRAMVAAIAAPRRNCAFQNWICNFSYIINWKSTANWQNTFKKNILRHDEEAGLLLTNSRGARGHMSALTHIHQCPQRPLKTAKNPPFPTKIRREYFKLLKSDFTGSWQSAID